MTGSVYRIGELSSLSGVSVRRIRFYSDRGLLPPKTRTRSGYRVYSPADLARLELIRALRDADVSLKVIRELLTRGLSLTEVLQMRLQTLEAEIESRQRVAAVLRATLSAPQRTDSDFARLWTAMTLSRTRLRDMIGDFVSRVTDGFQVTDAWKAQMVAASMPDLPQNPTPAQIDAWIEILGMFTDKTLIVEMRAEMASVWNREIHLSSYAAVTNKVLDNTRASMAKGIPPTSAVASAIAQEWLDRLAQLMQCDSQEAFMEWARMHNAHTLRFRKLLAVLGDDDHKASSGPEWLWLNEAVNAVLTPAA